MKELSLNILDIAENSIKAAATLIEIYLLQVNNKLTLTVKDNGCGMTADILEGVTNPFYTTRTTRNVGLGLPILKMQAEQTGGSMSVASISSLDDAENHGTVVTAQFFTDHIDFVPLGDIIATITTLIQGNPSTDFLFKHQFDSKEVLLDTREIRAVLDDVPLNSYEVINWIADFLREQYGNS